MKCPACNAAELVHEARDVAYEYKGYKTVFPDVIGEHCPACKEIVLNQDEGRGLMGVTKDFQNEVEKFTGLHTWTASTK